VLGWSLLAPSAALAVARLLRSERPAIIAGEAVAPLGTAPAVLALALAGLRRRRALAVAAGGLIGLELWWLAPELIPRRPRPVEADGAPRLRVFTANIYSLNPDMAGLAAEMRAADADVVVLQELSPRNLAALERLGTLDAYPHRSLSPRSDTFGTAILSRLRLVDDDVHDVAGSPMARGTVLLGDRKVRVYCVHTKAPFGPYGLIHWRDQLAALTETLDGEARPLIVAGDFNATGRQRRFRSLLGKGLRDVHVEAGRGWARTWPNHYRPVPALARIDHVLVSHDFAVLAVGEGEGRGSDHRPVMVDLALMDP
jgi:endonuclease/exonuclease/phosphatase (EEP) superfamily protein YafD